ncbi:MAG TPA: preprotein translocase subunit SecA [Acidimicrobiia bacterium]|jgi:preprotein translocase subunit SecA|nr:preprotein translocase subunit SecA [Acidimicrobiia bacterium]
MGVFERLLHVGEGRKLKALESLVPEVGAYEPEMEGRTDEELRALTGDLRGRIDRAGDPVTERDRRLDALDDVLPEAFALVRETARRTLGQRHFDVQVMGGAALHLGWVSEMKTGEGKTLVATLPVYLNALAGYGVHVVTVNDYLARRDAEWMGQIYRSLGLDVGVVIPDIADYGEKRRAYQADLTYGTNNEFGFDYLRDNMAGSREDQVQRGHYFAIVDEVDSILVDEARTPLIISGPADDAQALYYQFARIVRPLQAERDYEVDEAKRTVAPTEEGIGRVEEALGITNLYEHVNQNFVHQLQAALRAKELFKRDVDYVIQGGEVKIVDEFTGRILEGRRWSEGLHQAVEAKEGVRIKEENQTLATITLQNYFRLYDKLSGMTGTASTEAGEFAHTYALEVVTIPTNAPMIRADNADLIYKTEEAKFNAVADDIEERHEEGQPVLVGTISVDKSEVLSRILNQRGVPHSVLNAKAHEPEAHIVAQAGRSSTVTVATNMAGRGVDIILGGNPEELARRDLLADGKQPEGDPARFAELVDRYSAECAEDADRVRDVGGLYVLGTERHESRRIDNQLRGRSGRQGDPGSTRFYLSLEDDLMRLFATGAMSWVMDRAFPDDMPLEARMVTKAIERAQHTVEDRNFEIRKDVLKYDEVMSEQRKVIYQRRQQILDGEELRDGTFEAIEAIVEGLLGAFCPGEFPEDWDLDEFSRNLATTLPTDITRAQLDDCLHIDQLRELVLGEALAKYEAKEQTIGKETLREIERRVMLSVIDQHWREHLYEMDYLREGINLRAMGQKDPLAEWQREGYDMFEAMMASIEEDFVRYVTHLQVIAEDEPAPVATNMRYSGPEDPVQGAAGLLSTLAAAPPEEQPALAEAPAGPAAAQAFDPNDPNVTLEPVRVEKTPGRNEPCYCGSGKKYKLCHGR